MKLEVIAEGKHIQFLDAGYSASGKTHIWEIRAKANNSLLGLVQWNGPWRCYSHFIYPSMFSGPKDYLVFEKQCERDIANFCEKQTKLHREKLQIIKSEVKQP